MSTIFQYLELSPECFFDLKIQPPEPDRQRLVTERQDDRDDKIINVKRWSTESHEFDKDAGIFMEFRLALKLHRYLSIEAEYDIPPSREDR